MPLSTADVPFVFNEVTADFQDATIQGQLTYRIQEPKQVAPRYWTSASICAAAATVPATREKLNDRLVHA